MSSVSLNVNAVKIKYTLHIEELEKLEKYLKKHNDTRLLGKPMKKSRIKFDTKKPLEIQTLGEAQQKNIIEDDESYQRLICLIPSNLRVYILQY